MNDHDDGEVRHGIMIITSCVCYVGEQYLLFACVTVNIIVDEEN